MSTSRAARPPGSTARTSAPVATSWTSAALSMSPVTTMRRPSDVSAVVDGRATDRTSPTAAPVATSRTRTTPSSAQDAAMRVPSRLNVGA